MAPPLQERETGGRVASPLAVDPSQRTEELKSRTRGRTTFNGPVSATAECATFAAAQGAAPLPTKRLPFLLLDDITAFLQTGMARFNGAFLVGLSDVPTYTCHFKLTAFGENLGQK